MEIVSLDILRCCRARRQIEALAEHVACDGGKMGAYWGAENIDVLIVCA